MVVLFCTVVVELTVTTVPFAVVVFWIVEFTETVVELERSPFSTCLFSTSVVVVEDEFDEDEFSEVVEVDEFDEDELEEDDEDEEDEEDEVDEVGEEGSFIEVELEEDPEGDGTFDDAEGAGTIAKVELDSEGDGTFDDAKGVGTFAEVEDELEEDGEGEVTFDDWFEDVSFWHKYDWVSFMRSAWEGTHHVVLTPAP